MKTTLVVLLTVLAIACVPIGAAGQSEGQVGGDVVETGSEGDASSPGRPNGGKVLIASAAYPGLGQLLNGTERKAAIVGGAEALLIAQLLLEDRWTRYALKNYRETGDNDYFEEYSEHFDRRQTLIWWTAILALYSITDAYVDAHLSGFDDNTPGGLDAAVAASPAIGGDGFRVGFEVRF